MRNVSFPEYLFEQFGKETVLELINTFMQEKQYSDEQYYSNLYQLIEGMRWDAYTAVKRVLQAGITQNLIHQYDDIVFYCSDTGHLTFCRIQYVPVDWYAIEEWVHEIDFNGYWTAYAEDCLVEEEE